MATLPVFTPFMTSISLVSSVPPWNSTCSSPFERSVIALANQSSATAPDSGTGVICAMISFVGLVCANGGRLAECQDAGETAGALQDTAAARGRRALRSSDDLP